MARDGLRLALFISGSGTTASAIMTAVRSGKLSGITPACVIASRPGISGLERVKQAGIDPAAVYICRSEDFSSAEAFGEALLRICQRQRIDLVGQYGWLVKTPRNVIAAYAGRTINQHPGPLDPGRPDFGGPGMYGRRVIAARLLFVRRLDKDYWTEATAQRVAEEFDQGAVLRREQVAITPGDDVASLQERLLPAEHKVQIATLSDFANSRVRELARTVPLVADGEAGVLAECKTAAKLLYPSG